GVALRGGGSVSAQAEESRRRSSTPAHAPPHDEASTAHHPSAAHDPGAAHARSGPVSRGASADTALLERPVIAPTRAIPARRRRRRGPTDVDPRPGHIHGLDGLRAIAIIGVLIFHF